MDRSPGSGNGGRTRTGPDPAESRVDFALAAYREDGEWQVVAFPPRLGARLDRFLRALRQQPADSDVFGLVSVDEDYLVVVRYGHGRQRLLLSDVEAAEESRLAADVLAAVGPDATEAWPEEDDSAPDADPDEIRPAGELTILADLGVSPRELGSLCADPDLYPDEIAGCLAARLGFAEPLERALAEE